jgi:hypothetical protein
MLRYCGFIAAGFAFAIPAVARDFTLAEAE